MQKEATFVIDRITNSIVEVATGESVETAMILVTVNGIKTVHKKDGWFFNWKMEHKEPNHAVYKLVLAGDSKIQGLII
jgi:hypothetical protein